MRRNNHVFLLMFVFIMLSSFRLINAEEQKMVSRSAAVMPSYLKEVDEEAFAGTALNTVILPNGLLRIHEKAFADIIHLGDVYIPPTTIYIGEHVFEGSSKPTIHGVKGTFAEKWTKKHRLPFVADNIWCLLDSGEKSFSTHSSLQAVVVRMPKAKKAFLAKYSCNNKNRSMRPQDRPELNPIDYRFP